MKSPPRLSAIPAAWWIPAALLVIAAVYASQLVLAGHVPSWSAAFRTESAFWAAWILVALAIFRLCRWLHARPADWRSQAAAFVLGGVGVVLVFPLLFQSILFAEEALARAFGSASPASAIAFWPGVRGAMLNLLGLTLVLYMGTILGWYALTFHRGLQEGKIRAVELESRLHQARLEALRSQLHPHFLFNTLHSIAELVHENPALAERLLLRLAELLREILSVPARQQVPLAEELAFVRSYLEIEQMRLGERLAIVWEVDEDTHGAQVPSLVLQPLVENAIHHGIAALAVPGQLTIRARRENESLHLQVRDTGPGLPADVAVARGGIGLANTRDRLERLYGAGQRFDLVNGNGLTVNVWIPFNTALTPPLSGP